MDVSRLKEAADRLNASASRVSTAIDGVASELTTLRAQANNPPTPPPASAPPVDDTAQADIDQAASTLGAVADTLDRAVSTLDGVAAAGSGTANTPGGISPIGVTPSDAGPGSVPGALHLRAVPGGPDPLNPSA